MWIIQLCLVILMASLCGTLAQRHGQSRVVGEIAAGLVLGPSILGAVGLSCYDVVFSSAAAPITAMLGDLGLVLLMFQLGLHIDLKSIRGGGRIGAPVAVALLGIALPFALGCGLGAWSHPVFAHDVPALAYILFCGVTLSISALPVMARIIVDLGLANTANATIALAAAAITDVLGWLMVAITAALATGGLAMADIARNVLFLALFIVAALLVFRPLFGLLIRRAEAKGALVSLLPLVFCYVLLSSWLTSQMGFHSAFGALLAALSLRAHTALIHEWSQRVDGFVELVLMPVFFAYAGIHANLGSIPSGSFWSWLGLFCAAAIVGKFGGSYWGARLVGVAKPDAVMIATLMNTRGLMELIVLTIGLQLHVLPTAVYTMLVLMALGTTAMTVPLLRWQMRLPAADPMPAVHP